MFIFPGVITVEDFLTYPLLLFSQTDYNDKVNVAKDVVNSVTSRGDIFSKYNFSYNGMGFLFSLDDDVHVRFQYKAKLIEYELIDESYFICSNNINVSTNIQNYQSNNQNFKRLKSLIQAFLGWKGYFSD